MVNTIGISMTRPMDFLIFFKRIDTAFPGRKTYEMTSTMGENSGSGFPKLKEYIFSTTLNKVKEGAILIKGNIKAQVKKLKKKKISGFLVVQD